MAVMLKTINTMTQEDQKILRDIYSLYIQDKTSHKQFYNKYDIMFNNTVINNNPIMEILFSNKYSEKLICNLQIAGENLISFWQSKYQSDFSINKNSLLLSVFEMLSVEGERVKSGKRRRKHR